MPRKSKHRRDRSSPDSSFGPDGNAEVQKVTDIGCAHAAPTPTALRCLPHAAVPQLVAAWVVAPFMELDIMLSGDAVFARVCERESAPLQVEALHGLVTQAQSRGVELKFEHTRMLHDLLCGLCAVALSKGDLERLADVISTVVGGMAHDWRPRYALLASWCHFRSGQMSLGAFLAAWKDKDAVSHSKTVFRSQVAVDEFFLPALSAGHIFDFFPLYDDVRGVGKQPTVAFRDDVFARLGAAASGDADAMASVSHALYLSDCSSGDTTVFSEPEFVLDFCIRAVTLATRCGPGGRCVWWPFYLFRNATSPRMKGAWSLPLARAARDTFFMPAVDCFVHPFTDRTSKLRNSTRSLAMQCLDNMTSADPKIAALFCTAEFRDRFFIALFQTEQPPHRPDEHFALEMSSLCCHTSNALLHIATAVPAAQRQEVFATPEFCDRVIVPLIELAAVHTRDPRVEALETAFIAIAENEDGTLHPTFADGSSKKKIVELRREHRSKCIT